MTSDLVLHFIPGFEADLCIYLSCKLSLKKNVLQILGNHIQWNAGAHLFS